MPQVFSRRFRVRHYECDGYGHVNHAHYLRWMQEAAFDASAAVGLGQDYYRSSGHHWWIRETEIEYLRPLTYNQEIKVTTWVHDVRRVRSRRLYEFHLEESGELVARAGTDWVFLNSSTGRPATVPDSVIRAYVAEGVPHNPEPRRRFLQPPPPPPDVFATQLAVQWRDIDGEGHLNNANYLAYIEEGNIRVMEHFKWPMQRCLGQGFGIIAHKYQIEYLLPAQLHDVLQITTWVSHVRQASAMRHSNVRRAADGALLARASALWAWVNLANGRPIRIPPEFLVDFSANISPASGG